MNRIDNRYWDKRFVPESRSLKRRGGEGTLVEGPDFIVFDRTTDKQDPVERIEQESLESRFGRKLVDFLHIDVYKRQKLHLQLNKYISILRHKISLTSASMVTDKFNGYMLKVTR